MNQKCMELLEKYLAEHSSFRTGRQIIVRRNAGLATLMLEYDSNGWFALELKHVGHSNGGCDWVFTPKNVEERGNRVRFVTAEGMSQVDYSH